MGSRFDEVDLLIVNPLEERAEAPPKAEVKAPVVERSHRSDVSRLRRLLSLGTDVSLFVAVALALSPLYPARLSPAAWEVSDLFIAFGVTGFLLLLSYYYFAVSWLIWGKTIGGAIFDVRVTSNAGTPLDAKSATARWLATLLSFLTAGIGFVPALLPQGRSLADRLSATHSVRE
jgi:uncharacterized RDD family membrane protein YckC